MVQSQYLNKVMLLFITVYSTNLIFQPSILPSHVSCPFVIFGRLHGYCGAFNTVCCTTMFNV